MTSRELTYISEMGKRIESKLDSILASLEVGKDAENRSNNTAKSDCEIKKKTASGGKQSYQSAISPKDICTYREIASKSYQGKISPVSKV